MIKKNSYVRIRKTILTKEERALNLPIDTKSVPLNMWVKGYLLNDAELDESVYIKTKTGRIESGILMESNPSYKHNYGDFLPEILKIEEIIMSEMGRDIHE